MTVTNNKINVTLNMLVDAGMTKVTEIGVPTENGLIWKGFYDLEEKDFDAIEEYFIKKNKND